MGEEERVCFFELYSGKSLLQLNARLKELKDLPVIQRGFGPEAGILAELNQLELDVVEALTKQRKAQEQAI